MEGDVYHQLALHLSYLGLGLPVCKELEDILRENFSPLEAKVALSLPTKVSPLKPVTIDDDIPEIDISREELAKTLENLSSKGLIYSGQTKEGKKGYALHQMGYGFPQTFFWKGEKSPFTKRMAELITSYNRAKNLNYEVYAKTKTKNYRYSPAMAAIDHMLDHEHGRHAVYPFDRMEEVIRKAKTIALANCSCRVRAELLEKRRCDHSLEVCIKYDEFAEYTIEQGLAKEITKDKALEILRKSEEAGLVHMVDDTQEGIKHTCNCCPCCCWSVGSISRRKIKRDDLIAVYFIRETDKDECTRCGQCVDICPVNAIHLKDDSLAVDKEWCIGCGLCIHPCPTSAAKLRRKTPSTPSKNFDELHKAILEEKQSIAMPSEENLSGKNQTLDSKKKV